MPPPIFPSAPVSKPKQKEKSLLLTFVLFSPVLLLFFIGGVYFGSTFVDDGMGSPGSGKGPPMIRSVSTKWSHLRGQNNIAPPQLLNHFGKELSEYSNTAVDEEAAKVSLGEPGGTMDRGAIIAGAGVPAPIVKHLEKRSGDVAESHPITGAEIAHHLKDSLEVSGSVIFDASTGLDSQNLLLGAWVYLRALPVEGTMRTVFTNKATGCEATRDRYGVAMYVNEWETSNHELYVEWGNDVSGCNKIGSGGVQLMPEKWYHVAVALVGSTVELYMDGTVVGKSDNQTPHEVQSSRVMSVGAFGSGDLPLMGNVSHFAVAHPSAAESTGLALKKMMHIAGLSGDLDHSAAAQGDGGLFALFEFSDFTSARRASTDGTAPTTDSISQRKGIYHFPAKAPPSRGVSGVPIPLVDGVNGRPVTAEMKAAADDMGRVRREKVKEAMQFAWKGYKTHAWGKDELKPLTNSGENPWGGLGVTLVDSLDTLWVMGLKQEFVEAVAWVEKSLSFDHTHSVSVFETTIRELGGLLAAYDLSGHSVLLDKAKDLGNRLLSAFSGDIGIPRSQVDLSSRSSSQGWAGGSAILSELGTLQVEFRYLSQATKDMKYEKASMRPLQIMRTKNPPHGLYPIKVSLTSGEFTDKTVTFGALGDSFYEYLLKVWLQGGREEAWLRDMYDKAMDGVVNILLKASQSGLAFLSDWDGHNNHLKMDHLVCFMPGLMTLGAYTDPLGLESARAQRDLAVAKALMYTCREMYHRTATGIAPEFVTFDSRNDMNTRTSAKFYILRPETAESLFIMNQLTGDPIYREWAWEIWSAIDRHCRKGSGFASLQDVNNAQSPVDNRMESFFLAETMKYLYLAQDPDNEIDLMKYVFNTEAHPMKIFEKGSHKAVPAS